ncbi:Myb-like DNA-binding domain containing protein [Tritrichomonas foetus]|uniref:Myb-like DNA-binding domain containing protein n=1 Tax=Tritrichomonas foetus TaxID=1144522 RepID=A0A1J4K9I2_9EUKA|nr:Myb-like DNA-binding domain containing protein [Tritrichomonas foetus]|eukprot:OHT08129.1 Myb-like DNA-binding domain containing protein [Tritrichomonas foetus]
MEVRLKTGNKKKVVESAPSSESDSPIEPIRINDIFKYYDFEPTSIGDKQVAEIIRQGKKNRMQTIIDRLNRSLPQIAQFFPNFSPLEYYIAFDECQNDPETLILQSTDKEFLKKIHESAIERKSLLDPKKRKKKEKELEKERMKELNEEEESGESDDNDQSPIIYSDTDFIKHKPHKRHDLSKKIDLPVPKGIDPKDWRKWSTIHQASYLAGMNNPNTYFYRNLPPGEKQKNGAWSKEEKKLFLNRLEEMREHGNTKSQWGIFSQAIPGRVGYQCANYYRKLVMDKEIEDPAYYVDEEGVLRHRKISGEPRNNSKYMPKKEKGEKPLSLYERKAKKNPFKNVIDNITKEEIKVPAMSPDGYVLDYNTWLSIIKGKLDNPYTRAHIKTKRELVILTTKNIDQYRDKIKNITFDEQQS